MDLVVYDRETPRIVVDITTSEEIPQKDDSSKLRFDPRVRNVQSYATTLKAPFFLLTNGETYLWFRTDDSGRPQIISEPVLPTMSASEVSSHLTKDIIVRKLNELRSVLYKSGAKVPAGEIAFIIYAKLLRERGDDRLQTALVASTYDREAPYRFDRHSFSQLQLSDYFWEDVFSRRYYEHVFWVLDQITFTNAQAQDLLNAINEVVIRDQSTFEFSRSPHWLADLLVRLSGIHDSDHVLDMYSTYGDIFSALLMSQADFPLENFWGICPNAPGVLWANIQQLILRSQLIPRSQDGTTNFIVNSAPYDLWERRRFPPPSRIIVAPPFGGRIDKFNLPHEAVSYAKQIEDFYLLLAMQLISEKGRVVILVPEGLLFKQNGLSLRQRLLYNMRVVAIISLGPSVPPFPVKTSILVLDKNPKSDPYQIFLAHISKVPAPEAFDSRKSTQISRMLQAFDQWAATGHLDPSTDAQLLASGNLDPHNLSVSHYFSPSFIGNEDIASSYPLVRLQEIVKDTKRGAKIKLDDEGAILVIGPSAIRPIFLDIQKINRTSQDNVPQGGPFAQSGDVIINNIGTHLGDAAAVDDDLNGALISQHAIIVRPDEKRILPEYLAIALNSDIVRNQAEGMAKGLVIPGLNLNAIRQLFIPVPDMSVQLRIVEKMRQARVELLRAQEQLSQAETQFKALIRELTTGGDEA